MVASRSVPGGPSAEFAQALVDLRAARLRPEVRVTEVPAPQRIAPYAVALTGEVVSVTVDEADLGTGRIILLHDPAGNDAWEGTFRCVAYARAEIDPELISDPMLAAVGWTWLTGALDGHDADYTAEAGTVTRVVSESFAGLADRSATVEMEVRASWTPLTGAIGVHLQAWADLLCTIAGLPPLPEGVVALPGPWR